MWQYHLNFFSTPLLQLYLNYLKKDEDFDSHEVKHGRHANMVDHSNINFRTKDLILLNQPATRAEHRLLLLFTHSIVLLGFHQTAIIFDIAFVQVVHPQAVGFSMNLCVLGAWVL